MMKRSYIPAVLAIALILTLFSQVPALGSNAYRETEYRSSQKLMVQLGIMTENQSGDFEPDRLVTREEFSKIMMTFAGLEGKANLYKGRSMYSDVRIDRWSNGYIGAAVAEGFIAPMPDGLFHPQNPVTLSQVALATGRLLGYNDTDLAGKWPYNYLTLVESLEISGGVTWKPNDFISRKEIAVVLSRILQTEIKSGGKRYIETTKDLKNIIILETANIRPDFERNRVLTDAGVVYLGEGMELPAVGASFVARIENGVIQTMADRGYTFRQYSIQGVEKGFVQLNDNRSLQLPKNIPYYYNGATVNVTEVTGLLKANSSVLIAEAAGVDQYAILYDPIYSSPKIITQEMTGDMLERLYSGKLIDKGGKSIRPAQLEVNDVAYEVSDIWNRFSFIKVFSEQVTGNVTAVLPDLLSPTQIEIDGVKYSLDISFPVRRINGAGTIAVGNSVNLLLGENGKAVDILMGLQGVNSHYALVVDYYEKVSEKTEDFGKTLYYVNLLHTDGNIKTYFAEKDYGKFKGDLVTFSIDETGEEYDTVTLTEVEYVKTNSSHEVHKDDRKLNDSYVADNVVIFNLIHNVYGRDSDASILKWSDMPAGRIDASKVKYIHTSGDFADIDVLFVDNILDEGLAYGLITASKITYSKEDTLQTLTMLIGGKVYTHTGTPIPGATEGTVVRVRMSKGSILDVDRTMNAYKATSIIQAADSSRIRIDNTTYSYHRDLAIYKMNTGNTWGRAGTNELTKGESTSVITLYLDKALSSGGKVVMILIR